LVKEVYYNMNKLFKKLSNVDLLTYLITVGGLSVSLLSFIKGMTFPGLLGLLVFIAGSIIGYFEATGQVKDD